MENHQPYQERLHREPDFVVEYEIDLCKELKDAKPGQGMRTDFLYEGDDPVVDGIHMIWPEILNEEGKFIMDLTPGAIPTKGKANMWVLNEMQRRISCATNKIRYARLLGTRELPGCECARHGSWQPKMLARHWAVCRLPIIVATRC